MTVICVHGENVTVCWDSLTLDQRAVFDDLYRHAYDWALESATGGDTELAEAYATWYAADNYQSFEDASWHSFDAYEHWRLTVFLASLEEEACPQSTQERTRA